MFQEKETQVHVEYFLNTNLPDDTNSIRKQIIRAIRVIRVPRKRKIADTYNQRDIIFEHEFPRSHE